MSTSQVLTPPSTSATTVSPGPVHRHRFHSEGEASAPEESRRKRAIRMRKRQRYEEMKQHRNPNNHSELRSTRRRPKRHNKTSNGESHLQPMAPYNTTQFLLDDRVEREHPELDQFADVDDTIGTAVVDHRFRCYSVSEEAQFHSSSGEMSASDEEMSNNMERDFEADFESVKLERFDQMSRDEVTRAMLQMERSHGDLADHVVELRCENEKLKKLLVENGIAFTNRTTQSIGRRRRSSNESSLGSNASASNSNDEKPPLQ